MDSSMGRETSHQRPRVSVVLIFLDEEPFLEEAVDSVLSQTFEAWELLLVDDGSTDGSTESAKVAARRLPQKVRFYEHEGHANRGISTSRNVGLKHAQGEYVLFLDGDDVLTRNALSEQVALMEAHPEVGMVYGPLQWWYGWNGDPDEQLRDYIQNLDQEPNTTIEPPTLVASFLRNQHATPSGNLFRTSLVREVGGFEDEFVGMYDDTVLRVKFCLRFPVYVSSRVWYKYRKHADSTCAQAWKMNKVHEARGRFLYWTENYFRQHHLRDARVWKALREALHPFRYPRLTMVEKKMGLYKTRMVWRMVETAIPIARRVLPKAIRERIWNYLRHILRF